MISLQTVLIFISAYGTGAYFVETANTQPFIAPLPGYLVIFLIGFVMVAVSLVIDFIDHPRRETVRSAVVLMGLLVVTTIFLRHQIIARQKSLGIVARNDGVVQTEEAARFLLRGQNPYTADYGTTAFGSFPSLYRPDAPNLAAQHFAYPPLTILLFTPFVWLKDTLQQTIDFQSLYLLNLFVLVGLLFAVTPRWSLRTLVVILTLGNPFLVASALSGFNDLLVVTGVLGAVILISRQRWLLSGIIFGLVLAAKQTAWVLLPIFIYWVWMKRDKKKVKKTFWRWCIGTGITALAVYLPFFLWNPGAIHDDLVRYIGGAIPHTMPIAGTTVMQYLHISGLVNDPWSTFPVWIIQAPILAMVWWAAIRTMKKQPSESSLLTLTGIVTLVAILTNRFGGNNYFMIPMTLFIAAFVYGQHHHQSNEF